MVNTNSKGDKGVTLFQASFPLKPLLLLSIDVNSKLHRGNAPHDILYKDRREFEGK